MRATLVVLPAIAWMLVPHAFSQSIAQDQQWEVVDSGLIQSWNPLADDFGQWVYRIRFPRGTANSPIDRITEPGMLAASDGSLVGVRLSSDPRVRELFRYDGRDGSMSQWPVPTDTWLFFHDLAVSPDGRYLAYVRSRVPSTFAALVELETGRTVYESPPAGGCDCDVDLNHARWVSADSFQIAVASPADNVGWLIVSGNARTNRVVVDTVPSEPTWHAP